MKNMRELDYWRIWFEFFLVSMLGTALLRVLTMTVLESLFTAKGARFAEGTVVETSIYWATFVPVSYCTFRYVVRKRFVKREENRGQLT